MTEFGKTLRAAREARGLSVAQLAEMTHMTPTRVEELEAENFASIPAAIYGRGFVRLYCNAVGLDPKPLSDEFTEIFNGNRDLEIRERAPEPEPIRVTEEGLTRTHGAAGTSDVGVSPLGLASDPTPPISEPRPASGDLFAEPDPSPTPAEPAAEHGATLSRYAAPPRERPALAIPPTVWRLALLGGAALLVLWALAVGVRALYRATGGAPADRPPAGEVAPAETPETPATAEKAGKAAADNAAPRTLQEIPSLYID